MPAYVGDHLNTIGRAAAAAGRANRAVARSAKPRPRRRAGGPAASKTSSRCRRPLAVAVFVAAAAASTVYAAVLALGSPMLLVTQLLPPLSSPPPPPTWLLPARPLLSAPSAALRGSLFGGVAIVGAAVTAADEALARMAAADLAAPRCLSIPKAVPEAARADLVQRGASVSETALASHAAHLSAMFHVAAATAGDAPDLWWLVVDVDDVDLRLALAPATVAAIRAAVPAPASSAQATTAYVKRTLLLLLLAAATTADRLLPSHY